MDLDQTTKAWYIALGVALLLISGAYSIIASMPHMRVRSAKRASLIWIRSGLTLQATALMTAAMAGPNRTTHMIADAIGIMACPTLLIGFWKLVQRSNAA